ncbi:MAG: hypothetical protein U0798_14680 [Gemmataceae bacterium]
MNPFFLAAMQSVSRQLSFRRAVCGHLVVMSMLAYLVSQATPIGPPGLAGYLALILGLIEGAALIGWRLTQIPKSQALEFLLVSPIRPRAVFRSEALIGIIRFLFVQLSSLPILLWAQFEASGDHGLLIPLLLMPAIWGVVAGLLITAWVYEPIVVRKLGEIGGLIGVLIYLVVGLLAGEHLRIWLEALPEWLGRAIFDSIMLFHQVNPFGLVNYFFEPGSVPEVFWERFAVLHSLVAVGVALATWRAANRLQAHFQDLNFAPNFTNRPDELALIGDRPLDWWAVRRVMVYSGRVNLWLAGGVAILYAARILAGDSWPPQLGNLVFIIFEQWGGASGMATVLCVLGSVPAVFQYGLWDATPSDRCKRLELLLLSELDGRDYARAAFAASWVRGRGYFFAAAILWLALGISGNNSWLDVLGAYLGAIVLFALSFAVGFRSFTKGNQSNGIASLMTLGFPALLAIMVRFVGDGPASLLPHGWCYIPLRSGLSLWWLAGISVGAILAYGLIRTSLRNCVADLQTWYDQNHGRKTAE